MERWCETACAVVNGYRVGPTSPAKEAANCVHWQRVIPDLAQESSDAAARLSAGAYDHIIRRLPHVGERNSVR